MKIKNITKAVNAIATKGTRVVSFEYNGRTRNAIVGANLPNGGPSWAESVTGRSLVKHENGHSYLIPRMMNEPVKYKAFDVKKIKKFSFKA
jgi:hypothetical protein